MEYYSEFFSIIKNFEKDNINYAVIGGAALAFHAKPRFTRDIDILVEEKQLEQVEAILKKKNYFKSTDPHPFLHIALTLYRFIKTKENDHLMVDILVGKSNEFDQIIRNALKVDSEFGNVAIARKKDLIWLKRARNSEQDKIDIKKLSADDQEENKD